MKLMRPNYVLAKMCPAGGEGKEEQERRETEEQVAGEGSTLTNDAQLCAGKNVFCRKNEREGRGRSKRDPL